MILTDKVDELESRKGESDLDGGIGKTDNEMYELGRSSMG